MDGTLITSTAVSEFDRTSKNIPNIVMSISQWRVFPRLPSKNRTSRSVLMNTTAAVLATFNVLHIDRERVTFQRIADIIELRFELKDRNDTPALLESPASSSRAVAVLPRGAISFSRSSIKVHVRTSEPSSRKGKSPAAPSAIKAATPVTSCSGSPRLA
jgi:hypothetical protein